MHNKADVSAATAQARINCFVHVPALHDLLWFFLQELSEMVQVGQSPSFVSRTVSKILDKSEGNAKSEEYLFSAESAPRLTMKWTGNGGLAGGEGGGEIGIRSFITIFAAVIRRKRLFWDRCANDVIDIVGILHWCSRQLQPPSDHGQQIFFQRFKEGSRSSIQTGRFRWSCRSVYQDLKWLHTYCPRN